MIFIGDPPILILEFLVSTFLVTIKLIINPSQHTNTPHITESVTGLDFESNNARENKSTNAGLDLAA